MDIVKKLLSVITPTWNESKNMSPDTESRNTTTDTRLENPSVDTNNMDIPDTLALAKLDREKQGPWEAEYSYGGEADLHQHCVSCDKNPGHKKFIPVDKFSIDCLPTGYRDTDMMDYIRVESDLTVRVTVKYVSDRRPASAPGSDEPYTGYSVRGQRRMAVGTGWVDSMDVCNDMEEKTCECKDCLNSSTPETKFGKISINTAAHVVFDDLEGDHTTCHLFFDRGSTPDNCSGVVTLTGMSCCRSHVVKDWCYMYHYTHDLDLAHRLHQTCEQRNKLKDTLSNKLPKICKYKWTLTPVDKQPLLFIVSHPHGCSKQISLGRWTCADKVDSQICSFVYTTATCPGSSGARVCMPSNRIYPGWGTGLSDFAAGHLGASGVHPGSNYCRCYPVCGLEQLGTVSVDMLHLDEVPWEDNFSYVEEEDLHKHYDNCQKNPGHQNFFPVEKFSMDKLPPCYRKDKILELIKRVSDLTVRVSVKYASGWRPATVPGTDIRYPWYSNRASKMRVGSGLMSCVRVYKNDGFNKTCECKECQNSLTPKSEFAYIYVKTAAHLVYDRWEGTHTTCHLFFNPETVVYKDVVTLTNMRFIENNTKIDECLMMFVTHDLDLAERLHPMKEMYKKCLSSFEHPQIYNRIEELTQNDRQNTNQGPPLHIMISHPHGCAKQVSIIYCDYTDIEDSQCPCASVPCAGSSGAPVIVLGRESVYPCCE